MALKYGGCISTTIWPDNRVYETRLAFILDVVRLRYRLVHVHQQVASGNLSPSPLQCKRLQMFSVKELSCLETVSEGRLVSKPDSFKQQPTALL